MGCWLGCGNCAFKCTFEPFRLCFQRQPTHNFGNLKLSNLNVTAEGFELLSCLSPYKPPTTNQKILITNTIGHFVYCFYALLFPKAVINSKTLHFLFSQPSTKELSVNLCQFLPQSHKKLNPLKFRHNFCLQENVMCMLEPFIEELLVLIKEAIYLFLK